VSINAGITQGTVSDSNNFKTLINYVRFSSSYMKFVDDTTVYTLSSDAGGMSQQFAADDLVK
jgi:hypothetical protein